MSTPAVCFFLLMMIGLGAAADVPFVFDESAFGVAGYSPDQIEQASASSSDLAGVPLVSSLSDNEIIEFPVTGGGSSPVSVTEKNVGELKATLDARVEPGESRVREEATVLALKYPGDLTIDQIASIYSYLKNGDDIKKGWGYVRDPRGIDDFGFANMTLRIGDRAKCVGGGDCDDFAILMSALVESIGGTTRIIMARNNIKGGHAYAEVYLGNLNEPNDQVEGIINWLKQQFNSDKIYTHIDTDTKDVWLNLDWGADETGNTHPGGPFYQGDKHIVLCIRDTFAKTPLNLPESFLENVERNPSAQTLYQNITSIVTVPASSIALTPNLNFIWSFSGIESGPITMALTQEGTELYGQAKYEPEDGNAWNADVVGSVTKNEVKLTMTAQKDNELITTIMTGIHADDTINGNFFQISGGKRGSSGTFSGMWISPDTSSYTPAIIEEPNVEIVENTDPSNAYAKPASRFIDIRQYAE